MKKERKNMAVTPEELSAFCAQVALLLSAGIPLYDGIGTLISKEEAPAGAMGGMIAKLAEEIMVTGNLYDALKADERWPKYLTEMVGVGEQSGHLEEVMNALSAYYEREGRIRETIGNAVTYPLMLGGILVVIIFVILWKVIPVFDQVIRGMGVTMSSTGMTLMRVGSVLGWAVMILTCLALLAGGVCLALLKTRKRGHVLRLLGRIAPAVIRLRRVLSASRVAGVLSLMLSGGFPIEEALRMTALVPEDEETAGRVNAIREKTEQGESFSDALEQSGIFDELHTRMIRVGVAAGRGDTVMSKVAALCEEEAESRIAHLIGIIEPTMVALLAVVAGAVLLAVMLPVTGVLTSML